MQQALDALTYKKWWRVGLGEPKDLKLEAAITFLNERLAQPEHEPVADDIASILACRDILDAQPVPPRILMMPQAAPPAAQQIDEAYAVGYSNGMTEGYEAGKAYAAAQRKPLPKGEWPKHPSVDDPYIGYDKSDLNDYAMQVLAAHGIKENT
jgi:hypothetical protein